MKFYLLSILTRCGEFEFSQPITINVESDESVEAITKEKVMDWYEGDLENYDPDGVAWFGNGNAVVCDQCTEITQEEYETFQKYASITKKMTGGDMG